MQPGSNAVLLESDTNELEIVEFRIDELDDSGKCIPCYYGVNVAKVREILRLPHLWKVFSNHPAIPGMIKLRDKVITVIDLAVMLNKRVDDMKADRIIVLEFNRLVIAIMVHSVSRIYRISWEQVEPPVKTMNTNQVTGLVKMDDRIILVLDFEKIIGELYQIYSMEPDASLVFDKGSLQKERNQRTVLIADDSPFIRNTMMSSLRLAGYKIIETENGEEAWEMITKKLETAQLKNIKITDEIALLITDIEMPKMDGLHLTSKVKKDDRLNDMPVVIFSSLASDDNIRKWEGLGASGILTKPDLPKLVDLVDKLILN